MPINNEYIHPESNENLRWNTTVAEPVKFPNGTTEYAARHPNGGGWVSVSSYVGHSVFVDVFGCVYGGANVTGDVQINPFGQVYNGATVSGNVRLSVGSDGSSTTSGTAQIRGIGKVVGNVLVSPNSSIALSGNTVMGSVFVSENTAIDGSKDILGSFFTVDSGPIELGPVAHSKIHPISGAESIGLKAGTFALVDNDFSDIERLNIRDEMVSAEWQGLEDEEPPDPEGPQAEIIDRPDVLPPPVAVPTNGKKKEPSFSVTTSSTSTAEKAKPTPIKKPAYGSCPTNIMDSLRRVERNGATPSGVMYNLEQLCRNVIQPLLKVYPNIIITSAWRSESSTHHGKGMAADIQVPGKSQIEVGRWISKNLDFSQLILEYDVSAQAVDGARGKWVHISYIDPNTPLPYNGNFSSNVRDMRVADNSGPRKFDTKHHSLVATNITSSKM